MSGFETSPLCCWCYFFCRSIRSTVSVCVTPTAAVAPPPPAPTAPSRTRACVPTTATTAAAKLATQRPTDRCGRDGPTHTHKQWHTHKAVHTQCAHALVLFILTHQSDHCWVLKIVFFFGQMKTESARAAKRFHLFSVEISLFQWNEMKNQFPWIKRLSWCNPTFFKNNVKTK